MVRRWSFINEIFKNYIVYEKILSSSKLLTFKSLVFLKKPSSGLTKFKRKFFINKKRRSFWLFYNNIMVKWSKEYFIMKNFFKFVFLYNLFKFNSVSFNFTLFLNKNNFYNFNNSVYFFFVNKNFNFSCTNFLNKQFFKNHHNLYICTNDEKNLQDNVLVINDIENIFFNYNKLLTLDYMFFFHNNFPFFIEIYNININLFYTKFCIK